ncbi:restriction endonuclease subunit S [uncultured Bartonella sp.]|uniref:restriction endonuclease subunit S n=1 Tax=uncultured Bartonella sp. TaxID=104108 RepID=UPI0025D8591B|nr:restriction endonuclease subunit S [uncultured Bartonella sp.]
MVTVKRQLRRFSGEWTEINLAKKSKLNARIGWQGLTKVEYLEYGFAYLVTGTDFKIGKIDWDNCCFVDKARYDRDPNIQIHTKDILITKDGTIGKIAYVSQLNSPATLNSGIFLIRPINSGAYVPEFIYHIMNSFIFGEFLSKLAAGSTINHLYQKDIIEFVFRVPQDLDEQTAIAEVLSDADCLIVSLQKLIAKKKAIKQGAMQELLTGKRRLPGFSGEWKRILLGQASLILRGGSPRPIQDYLTDSPLGINWIKIGDVKVDSKYIEHANEKIIPEGENKSRRVKAGDFLLSNSMSFGRPYILKIDGCIHDGWLVIQNYHNVFSTEFLYYYLVSEQTMAQYIHKASGSSVLNLNKDLVSSVEIVYPNQREQSAIAQVLSDMDAEIEKLEKKLSKYQKIKQSMMQELLTGRIRLIEAEPKQEQPATTSTKKHNQQFDDAVMIAGIVNAFHSKTFPLGRKKVQKLLYLMRRKEKADVSAFHKKAAGPYADSVRYNGGETIAEKRNYIAVQTNGKGTLFSRGANIGKALGYIQSWEKQASIDWLTSNFQYTRVDDLELFATVDMAICDLRKLHKPISVQTIKEFIHSTKEWRDKLDKTYFSDLNIQRAINKCREFFGGQ